MYSTYAPWSGIVSTGSRTLKVLDTKVRVNATHVYGFKCWKKDGEIVSEPEMYVRLEVDGWQVQTPITIYRGTGYYNF